jgi:hypothetical protein
MVAAWNAASACGLCPQKSSSSAPHCAEKNTHTAHRADNSADDSLLAAVQDFQAIDNSAAPCSHCVTHSPWQANSSSNTALPNNSSHGFVAPEAYVVVAEFSASNSLVEIHDHGPPGYSSPRYLLNSTFRI